MFASDDDKDKRELMQDFLQFLLDGAADRVPGARTPSLSDTIAQRVSQETQKKLDVLLPQYLDHALPQLLDEALQRQAAAGGAAPSLGRQPATLIATVAAVIFAVTAAVFATLYFTKPAPVSAIDNPYASDQLEPAASQPATSAPGQP